MFFFFFFNDTATTEIYTLSLHDALPISGASAASASLTWHTREDSNPESQFWRLLPSPSGRVRGVRVFTRIDRKSTRLNSSHVRISYAVFCLKKKRITRSESVVSQDLSTF